MVVIRLSIQQLGILKGMFTASTTVDSAAVPTPSRPPSSLSTSPASLTLSSSSTSSKTSSIASSSSSSSSSSSLSPSSSSPEPSASCDFEAGGLCGWSPDPQSGYTFRRHQGPTPDRTSGPGSDHTLKGVRGDAADRGHYVFSSGWDASGPDQTARLLSPPLAVLHPSDLSFWYQMNGQGVGSLAVVLHALTPGGARKARGVSLWEVTGRQGMNWQRHHLRLPSGRWQIEFRTKVKHSYGSDIALDDIVFDSPVNVHVFTTTATSPVTTTSKPTQTRIITTRFSTGTTPQSTQTSPLTSTTHQLSTSTMKSPSSRPVSKTTITSTETSTFFQPTSPTTSTTMSSSEKAHSSFRVSAGPTEVPTASSFKPSSTHKTNTVSSSTTTSVTSFSTSVLTSLSSNVLFTSTLSAGPVTNRVTRHTVSAQTTRQSSTNTPTSLTSVRTSSSTQTTKKPNKKTTISPQEPIATSTTSSPTTKKPFWSSTSTKGEKSKTTTKKEDAVTPRPSTPNTAPTTTKRKHVLVKAADGSRGLSSSERSVIIGVSVGVFVLLVGVGVAWEYRKKKRSQNRPAKQGVQQVIALQTVVHQPATSITTTPSPVHNGRPGTPAPSLVASSTVQVQRGSGYLSSIEKPADPLPATLRQDTLSA
ncbi:uncharacterized protein LOC143297123 [Babylonia areolata]|uniref:uncharacterized protein LOC143297123 n=1 Tax=Babylonia areolata TaxID=304850 RepID=UPI003FD371AE